MGDPSGAAQGFVCGAQWRYQRDREDCDAGISTSPARSRPRPSLVVRQGLSAVAVDAAANRNPGCVRRPRGRCDGIHYCRRRRKVHGEIQSSRPRLNRGRMRIYENLFIVKPDATEEDIDHLVEQMSKSVTTAGGTIDKVDKWGKRRLAYKIEKHREGSYILMQFTAEPA